MVKASRKPSEIWFLAMIYTFTNYMATKTQLSAHKTECVFNTT